MANTIIIILVLLCAFDAKAHQPHRGNVYASGGVYASRMFQRVDSTNATSIGGGIIAQGDVDRNGGIEIAMFSSDKESARKVGDEWVVESMQRMMITTGYRHWFFPWFSAELSLLSAYSMGEMRTRRRATFDPGQHTHAQAVTEYGLDFSLQGEVAARGKWRLVLDGRYFFPFKRYVREESAMVGIFLGLKKQVGTRKNEK